MNWCYLRRVAAFFITVLYGYDCQKTTLDNPPRSVNVALETVFAFNNNDKSADIKLIDQVQEFLKSVKNVISNNEVFRRAEDYNDDDIPLTFTDFIKSILLILSSYNEDDLEDVAAIIDEELRKYHYKGCKFYELIENREVRRFMADKLDKLRTKPGNALKVQLRAVIKKLTKENLSLKYKGISEYVDSLYKEGDAVKFNNFLKYMALYGKNTKRANLDLRKIIRRGLRNLIFDHYSKLDVDTRRDLKIKLETFWNNFNGIEVQHDVWKFESPTKSYKHRHAIKKKIETDSVNPDSIEVENMKAVTNKRMKKKKSSRNNMKVPKTNKMKVNKVPKLTFITLYPEAITFVKQHRHGNHKSKKGHKKHKSSRTKPIDSEGVTKFRAHEDSTAKKRVIFRSNYTIDVEDIKSTSNKIFNVRANRNIRFKKLRGTPLNKTTREYSKVKRIKARKYAADSKAIDSNEGLAIEAFDIDARKQAYRKSINANDNDTLTTTVTPLTNKTETDINSDVVKRIKHLETELNAVKEHIKINIDSTTRPDTNSNAFDILDFWEGPLSPSTPSSITKTNKTYSRTNLSTKGTNLSTKTIKTTIKQITKKKTSPKKNITLSATTTTTTESVKPKPKANFRSLVHDHEVEMNEILPITTTSALTTRFVDRVELKTHSFQTANTTITDHTTKSKIPNNITKLKVHNVTSTKAIDNIDKTTAYTTLYNKRSEDHDIETYLNDTKLLDDDFKSQMVKQKMADDLEKMIPNLKIETLGTTNDRFLVEKLATKDVLAAIDEGDDIY